MSVFTVADPGFPGGGCQTSGDFMRGELQLQKVLLFQFFAENYMKMTRFGPPRGARPWRPLDPPML